MAEQWIDAATAHRLAVTGAGAVSGPQALCARALAGLLRTKAEVLKSPSLAQENVDLPPTFWSNKGREGPKQNWATGDFVYWDQRDQQWQAFGVTFALSDVLELLPFEQRAVTSRGLSVAGNPAWVTARAARQFAYDKAGVNPMKAAAAVLDQAELGFITARAVLAQRFDAGRHSRPPSWDRPPDWETREWDIPAFYWREFKVGRQGVHDWDRGIFSGAGLGGQHLMKLSGVYFLAESLHSLLPAVMTASPAEEAPAETPAKDNPGGRPTAEWWDELWCHVMGQIYAGALTPNSQKVIEEAMHTWANDHGHEPAVSTIRLRARKLYKVLKEVENSLDR